MSATITIPEAEDMLGAEGFMLADIYAATAAYVAERGIDLDVSLDTPVLTTRDLSAIRARLAR